MIFTILASSSRRTQAASLFLASILSCSIVHAETVTAQTADSFVDSIGLNGLGGPHMSQYDDSRKSLYNTFPIKREYQMGVRYARYEFRPGTDLAPIIEAAKEGVRINALVSWLWTDPNANKDAKITDALEMLRQLPTGSVVTIEGNNESDMPEITGDFPRYKASTPEAHANQAALYAAVKADPNFKDTPVIAWTLGKNWPWGGNVGYGKYTSTDFDYQSVHSYPGNDTVYGSMFDEGHNQYMKLTNSINPPGAKPKPIMCTETGSGYSVTGPDKIEHNSELAQAKKTTLILAEDFRLGFVRTFLYGVGGQKPFGLDTRDDGTPRPAGQALAFLTSTLGEAKWNGTDWVAPKFDPGTLDISISGQPPSVRHVVLQKSDHSFYLLIWNDVVLWDDKAEKDLHNPPVNVTVHVSSSVPFAHAEVSAMDDKGIYTTQPGQLEGSAGDQTIALAVPDSVMLVHLVPSF